MLTAAALKTMLRENNLRLSKQLGQSHLIDPAAINRIVEACQLTRSERVVEIGAGLGALTEPLSEHAASVVAVEVDSGICRLLRDRLAARSNVFVQCQDVLSLTDDYLRQSVVVGAIPYSITSPILVWLGQRRSLLKRAILVTQQEVAERILAKPGSAAYGRLTVLVQYGWKVARVCSIARSAFFPQPAVDSACLRFVPQPHPAVSVADEAFFFEVVKTAFSQRRKTLANCLKQLPGKPLQPQGISAILKELGHAPSVRGETLSLAQFAALSNKLGEIGGCPRIADGALT